MANAFIPVRTGTLSDVWLAVSYSWGSGSRYFAADLELRADGGGLPGSVLESWPAQGGLGPIVLHVQSTGTALTAGTRYWLVLSDAGVAQGVKWYAPVADDGGSLASRTRRESWCNGGTIDDEGNRLLLDANGDGGVDLSDAIYVLRFRFTGGPPHVLGTACVNIPGCPDACS